MHDVFISYSSLNKNSADAICHAMEEKGIRCWYAPRDIKSGDTWAPAIVEAIRNSKVFLLIFSKESNLSDQVMNEVTNACKEKCIIIPFRIDDTEMCDGLAYYLNSVHWLDAYHSSMQEKVEELCKITQLILDNKWDKKRHRQKKPVKKMIVRSAFIGMMVLVLGIGGWLFIDSIPQTIKFFCISHIGLDRYTGIGPLMMSSDCEQILLQNKETMQCTIREIERPYDVVEEFEYNELDSLFTTMRWREGKRYIYFIEEENQLELVKIYDTKENKWVSEKEIKCELSQNERGANIITVNENLMSDNNDVETLRILVRKENESSVYSKIITINPDGTQSTIKIEDLKLERILFSLESFPDKTYFVMMDSSNHMKVFDFGAGKIVEDDVQTIYHEYMQYAENTITKVSKNKRYISDVEYLEDSVQIKVWDLETGKICFAEEDIFEVYFAENNKMYYFNRSKYELHVYDLITGRDTVVLDKAYFEKNSSFLNLPFACTYSDEFETFFFTCAVEDGVIEKHVDAQLITTDINGKILAKSEKIELNHGYFGSNIYIQNNAVIWEMMTVDIEKPLQDDEITVLYRALYTVDKDGKMDFSDDY